MTILSDLKNKNTEKQLLWLIALSQEVARNLVVMLMELGPTGGTPHAGHRAPFFLHQRLSIRSAMATNNASETLCRPMTQLPSIFKKTSAPMKDGFFPIRSPKPAAPSAPKTSSVQ